MFCCDIPNGATLVVNETFITWLNPMLKSCCKWVKLDPLISILSLSRYEWMSRVATTSRVQHSWKNTYPVVSPNIAIAGTSPFSIRNTSSNVPFSIAMLDYRNVHGIYWFPPCEIPHRISTHDQLLEYQHIVSNNSLWNHKSVVDFGEYG